MRRLGGWLLIFCCAMVFTFWVDLGDSFFGLPKVTQRVLFAANLTLFLFLLARFAGRPIAAVLDARRNGISEQLEQAERRIAEAGELRADLELRLAAVESEIRELRERAERDGAAEAEQIAGQTAREEERFLKRVADEIGRRRAEARQRLAEETAALTAQLTRELLERELTDADRSRLLADGLGVLRATAKE